MRILYYFLINLICSILTQAAIREWGQCGGRTYVGTSNCEQGTFCYRQDDWYSQCLKNCPSGWECNQILTTTKTTFSFQDDNVRLWGQCGGKTYRGSTNCEYGTYCYRFDDWYSQCLPGFSSTLTTRSTVPTTLEANLQVVKLWGQCDGRNYIGPKICENGTQCYRQNDWYSQCLTSCPFDWECSIRFTITTLKTVTSNSDTIKLWGQCDGKTYTGSHICENGTYCFRENEWYSQCLKDCPVGWECNNGTNNNSLNNTSNQTVNLWGQCGGKLYNGPTVCKQNSSCFEQNEWYSQCRLSCPFDWKCNNSTIFNSTTEVNNSTILNTTTEYNNSTLFNTTTEVSNTTNSNSTEYAKLYEKCDGKQFNGTKLCEKGTQCYRQNEWYSQCLTSCPIDWECSITTTTLKILTTNSDTIKLWGQCDGKTYTGSKICEKGTSCFRENEWYSQCLTKCPAEWECNQNISDNDSNLSYVKLWGKCGGLYYNGLNQCEKGSTCYRQNIWYSQCRLNCPSDWDCNNSLYKTLYEYLKNKNKVRPGGLCGGFFYKGPSECVDNFYCFKSNDLYSVCLRECPEGWACSNNKTLNSLN